MKLNLVLLIFFLKVRTIVTVTNFSRPNPTARIFEGSEAVDKQFPFIVLMVIYYGNESYFTKCTGSLLTLDMVLTAAHCVDDSTTPSQIFVMAGKADATHYLNIKGRLKYEEAIRFSYHSVSLQERIGKEILIHPNYPKKTEYDAALVRLIKKFEESDFISTINYTIDEIPLGADCTLVGYGNTGSGSGKLFFYLSHTLENRTKKCGHSKDMLHTYCDAYNSEHTCKGDSGSPVICNGLVYAINSRGLYKYGWNKECRTPAIEEYANIASMENETPFLVKYVNFLVKYIKTEPITTASTSSIMVFKWQLLLAIQLLVV